MKSWIHEIAESYVAAYKPVRRDLKENYVSLTEEQRFNLLSENVLVYLDEQLQNAFGFGMGDLSEEQLNTLFANLLEYKGAEEVAAEVEARHGREAGFAAGEKRLERLKRAKELAHERVAPASSNYTLRGVKGSRTLARFGEYKWEPGDEHILPLRGDPEEVERRSNRVREIVNQQRNNPPTDQFGRRLPTNLVGVQDPNDHFSTFVSPPREHGSYKFRAKK